MTMHIHTLFTGVANTHIITRAWGVVIVDAGMPRQAQRILAKLRALGHAPQDVRLILLTHGHIDHVGSAPALKRLTGAPIALHRGDAWLVATPDLKIPPGRNALIRAGNALIKPFGFLARIEPFVPDVTLEAGQALGEFGLEARIIHTPGHTAGSVSIVFDDGQMIIGDALLNLLRVSLPLVGEDFTAARESVWKIRALRPRVCHTGHGRAFGWDELEGFVSKPC